MAHGTQTLTEHPPSSPISKPTTAPVSPHRSPWWWALLASPIAVVIPVATAASVGDAPYERLHRGFPRDATSLTTAALPDRAELSGFLTIGVLPHRLFLRSVRPEAVQYVDPRFVMRVLPVASGAWVKFAGLLVVLIAFDANTQSITRFNAQDC